MGGPPPLACSRQPPASDVPRRSRRARAPGREARPAVPPVAEPAQPRMIDDHLRRRREQRQGRHRRTPGTDAAIEPHCRRAHRNDATVAAAHLRRRPKAAHQAEAGGAGGVLPREPHPASPRLRLRRPYCGRAPLAAARGVRAGTRRLHGDEARLERHLHPPQSPSQQPRPSELRPTQQQLGHAAPTLQRAGQSDPPPAHHGHGVQGAPTAQHVPAGQRAHQPRAARALDRAQPQPRPCARAGAPARPRPPHAGLRRTRRREGAAPPLPERRREGAALRLAGRKLVGASSQGGVTLRDAGGAAPCAHGVPCATRGADRHRRARQCRRTSCARAHVAPASHRDRLQPYPAVETRQHRQVGLPRELPPPFEEPRRRDDLAPRNRRLRLAARPQPGVPSVQRRPRRRIGAPDRRHRVGASAPGGLAPLHEGGPQAAAEQAGADGLARGRLEPLPRAGASPPVLPRVAERRARRTAQHGGGGGGGAACDGGADVHVLRPLHPPEEAPLQTRVAEHGGAQALRRRGRASPRLQTPACRAQPGVPRRKVRPLRRGKLHAGGHDPPRHDAAHAGDQRAHDQIQHVLTRGRAPRAPPPRRKGDLHSLARARGVDGSGERAAQTQRRRDCGPPPVRAEARGRDGVCQRVGVAPQPCAAAVVCSLPAQQGVAQSSLAPQAQPLDVSAEGEPRVQSVAQRLLLELLAVAAGHELRLVHDGIATQRLAPTAHRRCARAARTLGCRGTRRRGEPGSDGAPGGGTHPDSERLTEHAGAAAKLLVPRAQRRVPMVDQASNGMALLRSCGAEASRLVEASFHSQPRQGHAPPQQCRPPRLRVPQGHRPPAQHACRRQTLMRRPPPPKRRTRPFRHQSDARRSQPRRARRGPPPSAHRARPLTAVPPKRRRATQRRSVQKHRQPPAHAICQQPRPPPLRSVPATRLRLLPPPHRQLDDESAPRRQTRPRRASRPQHAPPPPPTRAATQRHSVPRAPAPPDGRHCHPLRRFSRASVRLRHGRRAA